MDIRMTTLWRVPVFCTIASWVCFQITIHWGGAFFGVRTPGADGVMEISVDPIRNAIFHGALFLAVLLLGGVWFFRSMTKAEIAVSAAILVAFYLVVSLVQLYLPNLSGPFSVMFMIVQGWPSSLFSLLFRLTGYFYIPMLISNFAPFLFVPFGKKFKV